MQPVTDKLPMTALVADRFVTVSLVTIASKMEDVPVIVSSNALKYCIYASVDERLVIVALVTIPLVIDKLVAVTFVAISLLTDNVPLTVSLVTDSLLIHKLPMQLPTERLVITALVADRLVTVSLVIIASKIEEVPVIVSSNTLKY
jgi:hypothetical protein